LQRPQRPWRASPEPRRIVIASDPCPSLTLAVRCQAARRRLLPGRSNRSYRASPYDPSERGALNRVSSRAAACQSLPQGPTANMQTMPSLVRRRNGTQRAAAAHPCVCAIHAARGLWLYLARASLLPEYGDEPDAINERPALCPTRCSRPSGLGGSVTRVTCARCSMKRR
jgi:hypothetical protein